MIVSLLPPSQRAEAVDVLCDAFHDYPVMRYVLGTKPDYAGRLRALIDYFVAARTLREEPVLGLRDASGAVVAAATVTLPGDRPSPEALAARREALWTQLGPAERERYEAFGNAGSRYAVVAPHHHLNMIGVRRSHAGRGLARPLLDAVHDLARSDPDSTGVSLTTESRPNVGLYEHFGYRLLGHARLAPDLETWAFFRPADRA